MRSWLSHKELAVVTADLKKSFLKKGIKKILLLISKNCQRHNVERHFFISAPGRAQTGFIPLHWELLCGPGSTTTIPVAHPGASQEQRACSPSLPAPWGGSQQL